MSIRTHFVRLLGLSPRREPVTMQSVQTAAPPWEALEVLEKAQSRTKELVFKLAETQRLAQSVQIQLAAAAMKIVQYREGP